MWLCFQSRPDGSLVYAKTTVGYSDDFEGSEIEEYMLVGIQVRFPVGGAIHAVLFQLKNNHPVTATNQREFPDSVTGFGAIDVHDVRIGDRQHYVPLPEDGPHFATLRVEEYIRQRVRRW